MNKEKLTATVVINESGVCFLVGSDILHLGLELDSQEGVFYCDEPSKQIHYLPFAEHPNVIRSQN